MKEGKTTFPIRIKSGSASVSIYDRSDAYPYYRVAHYVGSQREMKPFTRLADARLQARQIAEQISAGEGRAIRMSRADELIYQRAREVVAPLGLALDTAAIELAHACRLLGGHSGCRGGSIIPQSRRAPHHAQDPGRDCGGADRPEEGRWNERALL
jgi:hypothetical protein